MLRLEANIRHTKKYPIIAFLLPLAILGMTGSSITFLRTVCTGNVRWLVLITLFMYFLLKRNLLRYLDAQLILILALYLAWCFFTLFWSVVPMLSFLKTIILIIVVITMTNVGIEWIKISSWDHAFDAIWILAFVSLLAGLLGKYVTDLSLTNDIIIGSTVAFHGLVNGSNMFGALMAMSLPLFLWKSYRSLFDKSNKKYLIFWSIMTLLCLNFLMLSISRGSMLIAFLTLSGFLISLNLNKKIMLLLFGMMIFMCIVTIKHTILFDIEKLTKIYAYKGNASSLFYSRSEVWQKSYEGATEGGWIGLGYGASKDKAEFDLLHDGLTSYLYGREKGNSQLAIIEETGIIGFILYSLLLITILIRLFNLFIKTSNSSERVLIGLLSGTFLGMIGQSMFEAWWTAPGSQECIYFWWLVGIMRGLEILTKNKRTQYVKNRMEAKNS